LEKKAKQIIGKMQLPPEGGEGKLKIATERFEREEDKGSRLGRVKGLVGGEKGAG